MQTDVGSSRTKSVSVSEFPAPPRCECACLAAAQCPAGARKGEVADADIFETAQPDRDALEQRLHLRACLGREGDAVEESAQLSDGHLVQIVDGLAADRRRERSRRRRDPPHAGQRS